MDRFFELKNFVEVVEAGSISGAAERMDIAKSAVSRSLKTLESRLGTSLLARTTRRQSLTDAGAALYERSINILADLESAEEAATERSNTLRGRLRIAAPQTFGQLHVAPAVLEFIAWQPELLIEADFSDRRVDLVREGFDMAIRLGVLADSTLRARRLSRISASVCASPDYLARFGTPQTPDELAHHHCIRYNRVANVNIWHYRDRNLQPGQVHVPFRALSDSGEFICKAAIAGLGIILAPDFLVDKALAAGTLVSVLHEYEWYEGDPSLYVHAVFPPSRRMSRRVRVFTDFLAERLPD